MTSLTLISLGQSERGCLSGDLATPHRDYTMSPRVPPRMLPGCGRDARVRARMACMRISKNVLALVSLLSLVMAFALGCDDKGGGGKPAASGSATPAKVEKAKASAAPAASASGGSGSSGGW